MKANRILINGISLDLLLEHYYSIDILISEMLSSKYKEEIQERWYKTRIQNTDNEVEIEFFKPDKSIIL